MSELLPDFGNAAFTVIAFVVALSIIVAVHEFGHYIVGRWSGIHAEVFSLGFGPVLLARTDRRGTRWQLAALPLGGYVKFQGDANVASVGVHDVGEEERRRTMLGAPLWARAATVAAGPFFNFILSLVLFFAVILVQGRAAEPLTVGALLPLPPSYELELEPGDALLAVANQDIPSSGNTATFDALPMEPVLDYTVERDGEVMTVKGPYPSLPRATAVTPGSAAYDAGFRAGDVILAIDGAPIFAFQQLYDAVAASSGQPMGFQVWREGEDAPLDMIAAPRRSDQPLPDGGFETRWLLGVSSGLFFEPATETPGILSAAGQAAQQIWFILKSSVSGLWHMATGKISSCNLSGPVGIAQASGAMAEQGGASFLWFVAVLSTGVGLLNLFPVPILDGGHLVFHAWEGITGRMPSDGALRVLMATGLALIVMLMGLAFANDLFLCP